MERSRHLRLIVAAACLLAAWPAGALDVDRPSSEGWSLPAAVRAVALGNPELALPSGVSAAEMAALSLDSPIWARASESLAMRKWPGDSPEKIVQRALKETGKISSQPFSWSVGRFRFGGRTPSLAETVEMAPFAAVMSASARARLQRALSRHGILAANALTAADSTSESLAAGNIDPGFLVAQYATQVSKTLNRPLERYDNWLSLRRSYANAGVPPAPSLEGLAQAHSPVAAMLDEQRALHGEIVAADVGGGFGATLRELSQRGLGVGVERILVDLFDWARLHPDTVEGRSELSSPAYRPRLLLSDAASVSFPKDRRPHVIVSVASIQYWPDKIAGLANLYNQLADGGVLAVATNETGDSKDPPWPSLISTKGVRGGADRIFGDLVRSLTDAGVEVLALGRNPVGLDLIEYSHALYIRKKPGTLMVSQVRHHSSEIGGKDGYVGSYYDRDAGLAPVAIVNEDALRSP